MEFNLFLPQMRMAFPDLVARARAAEAAGFVGLTGMDHLAPPMAEDQPMYEAMVTTTWLAAHTETLRLGSLVLCDAFRLPAVLARAGHLDRPRVGRPLRARHRLGLGPRRVHDVRRRLHRAARAGGPAAREPRGDHRALGRRDRRLRRRVPPPRRRAPGTRAPRPDPDRDRRRRAPDARARARLRRLVERAHRPRRPDRGAARPHRLRPGVDPADGGARARGRRPRRGHRGRHPPVRLLAVR